MWDVVHRFPEDDWLRILGDVSIIMLIGCELAKNWAHVGIYDDGQGAADFTRYASVILWLMLISVVLVIGVLKIFRLISRHTFQEKTEQEETDWEESEAKSPHRKLVEFVQRVLMAVESLTEGGRGERSFVKRSSVDEKVKKEYLALQRFLAVGMAAEADERILRLYFADIRRSAQNDYAKWKVRFRTASSAADPTFLKHRPERCARCRRAGARGRACSCLRRKCCSPASR